MKVRVLGAHNLEAQDTRHTCFLVDGVIAVDAGSLMTSLNREEREKIRSVLLTHRHFDHIRDVPSLGLATLYNGHSIPIYSLPETLDAVFSRLMDGVLYPDLTTNLNKAGPKYRPHVITPGETLDVEGYAVRPVAVPHEAPAVGYVVHEPEGSSFAYCGDTGGGLLPFFQDPSKPDLLFIEVTFPERMKELAKITGHLTPKFLRAELVEVARQTKAMPRILIVHRAPDYEAEIAEELAGVSSELGIGLALASEGMTVEV